MVKSAGLRGENIRVDEQRKEIPSHKNQMIESAELREKNIRVNEQQKEILQRENQMVESAELRWEDLRISAQRKVILHRENGRIKPFTVTALLGTSGAGKTTLLNALAGRASLEIEGEILLNGNPRDKKCWPGQVAYVEQFFFAYKNQTVYETLFFASKMRKRDISKIDSLIAILGLEQSKDTRLCHLSGGEYKRVSIGVELVGHPLILFLDEPTSGLDSFNALNTLLHIKKLADQGMTVLMTIHQPSYEIIKLFDRIFLLSQGRSVFQGLIDECIGYFDTLGYTLPVNTNPCDYFLNLISINPLSEKDAQESKDRISKLQDAWKHHESCGSDTFNEIGSKIPDTAERISEGKRTDSMKICQSSSHNTLQEDSEHMSPQTDYDEDSHSCKDFFNNSQTMRQYLTSVHGTAANSQSQPQNQQKMNKTITINNKDLKPGNQHKMNKTFTIDNQHIESENRHKMNKTFLSENKDYKSANQQKMNKTFTLENKDHKPENQHEMNTSVTLENQDLISTNNGNALAQNTDSDQKKESNLESGHPSPLSHPTVPDSSLYNPLSTFVYLFMRNIKELWRDDKYLKIQCIQKVIFTLLIGLTYLQIGTDPSTIQSRMGVIFFILINTLFGTSGPVLNAFPSEKRIIVRERKSGMYDGVSAYLSKLSTLSLYNLLLTIVYISAVYWMVGLNPGAGRFFIFLIIQASSVLFAIAFGLTIGCIAPSENIAQVLGPTVLIFYIVFGGNFNNPDTIPKWLRWFIWISPVNYAYRAAIQNQFDGLNFGSISGAGYVQKIGLDNPGVWPNIYGLWGLTVGWILFGAIYLHFSTRIRIHIKSVRNTA